MMCPRPNVWRSHRLLGDHGVPVLILAVVHLLLVLLRDEHLFGRDPVQVEVGEHRHGPRVRGAVVVGTLLAVMAHPHLLLPLLPLLHLIRLPHAAHAH
eukprot:833308-Prorocentrum_minimum.AAC.2